MDIDISQHILEEKREPAEEFFINLFELCNLRCSFCWQNHEDRSGMDLVPDKAENVIAVMEKKSAVKKAYEVNVMGGELFFDEIPDKLFDDYFEFALKILDYARLKELAVSFNWVTNLVFTKRDRVLRLMERLKKSGADVCLTSSYDPRGRFNKKTFEIFWNNLGAFEGWLRNVSVVMTRPNIAAILKGDERLERLYQKKVSLFFDYYSPEESYETMLPKESDLFAFFKHMLEFYPEAQPFKAWRESPENKLTCRSSNVILPSGESGKCRALLSKAVEKLLSSPVDRKGNENMEASFVSKRNCLTCEYFKKCGLGCFLQNDFKGHSDLDDCLFYKTFKHIDRARDL